MDEFNQFFGINTQPVRIKKVIRSAPSHSSSCVPMDIVKNENTTKLEAKEEKPHIEDDKTYVQQYVLAEQARAANPPEMMEDNVLDDISVTESDINDLESIIDEEVSKIYEEYPLRDRHQQTYVIDEIKNEILEAIDKHTVTVIEGPVGCGKSTQVPQWILREYQKKKKNCKIVVTQPRRLSAISLANRVSEENTYTSGSIIGYKIGQHKKMSKYTKLEYVTVGVLLKDLITNRNINNYTHIIIDEVHERNKDIDFLLLVLRKFLWNTSTDIKVILMSATFNVNLFSTYFSLETETVTKVPAVIKVPEKYTHTTLTYYLEDVEEKLSKIPNITVQNPTLHRELIELIPILIDAFDKIDDAEKCAPMFLNRPTVLIFLPGLFEIDSVYEHLEQLSGDKGWILVPLHSTFSTEEQGKVFNVIPPGCRKIILSSNIAESSVTLPQIKYVIDFCLSRVLVKQDRYEQLKTVWSSKYNCIQRAGRAGRVRSGRIYRLITRQFYDSFLQEIEPEFQRGSLENTILQSKTLNMGSPKEILALALSPPDLSSINSAILNLKEIGALLPTVSGKQCESDGDLTHLGKLISRLPLDYQIAKVIILGYIMGCMEECIIIGVAMYSDSFFNASFREHLQGYSSKLTWSKGSNSDCFAFLNAYSFLKTLPWGKNLKPKFPRTKLIENNLHIGINEIREMFIKVNEVKSQLEALGFKNTMSDFTTTWSDEKRKLLLKVVLAGGLYPNYFIVPGFREDVEMEMSKLMRGRDPKTTVYVSNMDRTQPGEIYVEGIKKLFRNCTDDDILVDFDNMSSKVFITFPTNSTAKPTINNLVNGKIGFPIYKALKMNQLERHNMSIKVMKKNDLMKYMMRFGLSAARHSHMPTTMMQTNVIRPKLPRINENLIDVVVTNIVDCGHFFVQRADSLSKMQLDGLKGMLEGFLDFLQFPPNVGSFCGAPIKYKGAEFYARLQVKRVEDSRVYGFFIDYGLSYEGAYSNLINFGYRSNEICQIKSLAFECTLAEISPSIVCDESVIWTPAAINLFRDFVDGETITAKIYSVYNGLVSLELFKKDLNINKILIEKGFAEKIDECYDSKINHDMRLRSDYFDEPQISALTDSQDIVFTPKNTTFEPPFERECTVTIDLKGPFSPLQTNVAGVVNAEKMKEIKIHQTSVNSVLLHADSQFRNERLLIATHIYQTARENIISIRNTTLLPNIPGLPAILALLFSPKAELKRNTEKTHYNAVLCGFGHVNGVSICPDRDMVIRIDTNITQEDIDDINFIRYSMDSLLSNITNADIYLVSDEFQSEIILEIHKRLDRVISKNRGYREPGFVSKEFDWNVHLEDDLIKSQHMSDKNGVFPCHKRPKLSHVDDSTLKNLREKLVSVKEFCKRFELSNDSTMKCPICETPAMNAGNLRIHLYSISHKINASELNLNDIIF